MESNRFERGMRVRREVLGDAHVDTTASQTTALDADFQTFITEAAWGSVWARAGLDRSTRSLVTIAILAALGRRDELEMHLKASHNTGVEPVALTETLFHVAVYAGIPAAHSAFKLAKAEYPDSGATDQP